MFRKTIGIICAAVALVCLIPLVRNAVRHDMIMLPTDGVTILCTNARRNWSPDPRYRLHVDLVCDQVVVLYEGTRRRVCGGDARVHRPECRFYKLTHMLATPILDKHAEFVIPCFAYEHWSMWGAHFKIVRCSCVAPSALFGGVSLVLLVPAYVRRRVRRSRNGCLRCGYNLTGNVSGVCPECGTPIRSATRTS
jgi:hypothetical protein